MPHFPEWFVMICILLPIANLIYKAWKSRKKQQNWTIMKRTEWIRCPVCGGKTRDRIREDTVLKNYPLYCPKYKQEALSDVKNLQITVLTEPDTLDAEPMNV